MKITLPAMKLLYFIALLYFLLACSRNEGKSYQDIVRPVRVRTVALPGALDKVYTGIVAAEEFSDLAFKVGGPLVEMNIDAGETVKKGTLLAAIDPTDYQLQNDGNKAAYITARSRLERDRRLLEMQAISQQEFEMSEAGYIQSRSAYRASEKALSDTRLYAPFDGFIEQKYVENYQKVQPGERIVRLVNPDKLTVWFVLPETSVGLTREQMQVTVEFDIYRGLRFQARVQEFVDASPGGGGIPVRLILDDPLFDKTKYPVYPGFSVRVNLRTDNRIADHYVVPLSAVFMDPLTERTAVWRYHPENSTVTALSVTIGSLFGSDKVLITEGLQDGDVIVVDGMNFITEGQKVDVLTTELTVF